MEQFWKNTELHNNKAVLFYSAPKIGYIEMLRKYNVKSILISYWYIRKNVRMFRVFADYIREVGGYMMVDSGAHTFKHDEENREHWCKEESYKEYLDEYIQFCYDNYKDIYCCVNIDMDNWVGIDIVDKWNHTLFKPLNKVTNVIFNVDSRHNHLGVYDKTGGLIRLKEYVKQFDYIGVNRGIANKYSKQVFTEATLNNVRVHGFAVTSLSILKNNPMFSVDSTSWLSGDLYGATFTYDGKNFKSLDAKKKYVRKDQRVKVQELGIDHKLLEKDKSYQVTEFNLYAWKGFEREYIGIANMKLKTNNLRIYDKRGIIY